MLFSLSEYSQVIFSFLSLIILITSLSFNPNQEKERERELLVICQKDISQHIGVLAEEKAQAHTD